MKKRPRRNLAFLILFLFSIGFSGLAHAATIDVLTSKNTLLQINYGGGVVMTVEFRKSGKYRTSDGAYGRWTLTGERLCTYRNILSHHGGRAGKASCGVLPADKNLGDVWNMTKTDGAPIMVSIVPRGRGAKK